MWICMRSSGPASYHLSLGLPAPDRRQLIGPSRIRDRRKVHDAISSHQGELPIGIDGASTTADLGSWQPFGPY